MHNPRKYGKPPFRTVVVHGGPGAAGEAAPAARELGRRRGVLEPFQTESSLEGQVEELRSLVKSNALLPVCLIGFSWGAWLSFIAAARFPELVEKLILVGSGPFEEKYAAGILENRLSRMNEKERTLVLFLMSILEGISPGDKNAALARLGAVIEKADAFDPLPDDPKEKAEIIHRPDIFKRVWPEAAEMRKSGRLLNLASDITCPVRALHGDYDPHPADGVRVPLKAVVDDFHFYLLKKCGHKPWGERQARGTFFRILEEELPW